MVVLTHWGRVTHICVSKLTIIGSDNGLSPGRRQAIIGTNTGILLIGPLVTKFSENLIRIQTFSFKKMHLKMSSAKWRPFCLGLNVLTCHLWSPVTFTSEQFHSGEVTFHFRATDHHLSQCWPRFMSPLGVTRPQLPSTLTHITHTYPPLHRHRSLQYR